MIRLAIIALLCCVLSTVAWAQAPPRSFIVIQIQHASPLLIAYAVQADDVIWEDSGASGSGGGYGSSGRGQSTTYGGRSGSGYSRGGGQSGRSYR